MSESLQLPELIEIIRTEDGGEKVTFLLPVFGIDRDEWPVISMNRPEGYLGSSRADTIMAILRIVKRGAIEAERTLLAQFPDDIA